MAKATVYELELIPLPPGGQLDPETARAWIEEDMDKYGTLVQTAFEPSQVLPAPEDDTDSPLWGFHVLVDDMQAMVRACIETLTSGKPVPVTRSYNWDAARFVGILTLAQMHSAGAWGVGMLAPIVEEAYRLRRQEELERIERKALRKPPLSSLPPEEQARLGVEVHDCTPTDEQPEEQAIKTPEILIRTGRGGDEGTEFSFLFDESLHTVEGFLAAVRKWFEDAEYFEERG